MANFDMRGQNVTNQYNAGRDISFGAVQTSVDLVAELEILNENFDIAMAANIVSEEVATDAKYQVTKAIQSAKKLVPDKKTILDHLNTAKTYFEGIVAAGSLVTTLASAIDAVHKLFP